jgi:hypothetical protein
VSSAILGLVAAYVVIAVLLLSLNLTSLWRWWVKAGAIVITTLFFAITYRTIHGLMGWPTAQSMPARFSLVWTVVSEPNKLTKDPGAIYLWADALDANNVPSGRPRSYELPYTEALARKVAAAQEKREQGREVMGLRFDAKPPPNVQPAATDIKMGQTQTNKAARQNPAADTVPFMNDGTNLGFQDMPPVILPDKGPF